MAMEFFSEKHAYEKVIIRLVEQAVTDTASNEYKLRVFVCHFKERNKWGY